MTTGFRSARLTLGARLRELRTGAGLNGKGIAERLGRQRSKVSCLELGKQTPTPSDLNAWAHAVGRPDLAGEPTGRLSGIETKYRSRRRQLAAGHRAGQELAIAETADTKAIRGLEVARIPGLFQTPDYARATSATRSGWPACSRSNRTRWRTGTPAPKPKAPARQNSCRTGALAQHHWWAWTVSNRRHLLCKFDQARRSGGPPCARVSLEAAKVRH
ncbi:Scr1 family TA system antitoxin-like transcriptional regulator [Streptomyces violascens]|uniref:Scr1 family TA system antitoxin-like transcriptional regulator n=1 Tax=Streptomyces violascens TaxID=67381 RepID=UPI00367C9933